MSGEPDHAASKSKVKLEAYDNHKPHIACYAHTDKSL
jgi:hypothetical protein